MAGCEEDVFRLFSSVQSDRTRGSGHTGKEQILFECKKTRTVGVAEHWSTLFREVVESLSLEILEIQLGQGLGQLALDDPALSRDVGLCDLQRVHSASFVL